MIEMFKDNEMRNSGLIYNSTFSQIKQLHAMDPELAGELAISAIELVLTGEISSDDPMINLMLEPMKKINQNNQVKYDNKVETGKQKKIRELDLDRVAELMLAGYTQKQIGEKLGMPQQNVSYRVGVIRTKYPELLQTDSTKSLQDVCTNTLQTVQTNSTNTLQTIQTVQTDTKKEVCEADSVCRNSVKTGESKKKFDREAMKKNGFDF